MQGFFMDTMSKHAVVFNVIPKSHDLTISTKWLSSTDHVSI